MSDADDFAGAENAVDSFVSEVHRRRGALKAEPDADGFQKLAAAALLLRGLELLAAMRACSGSAGAPARELVLRSAVEVSLRGRFLLGPEGPDELGRMLGYLMETGPKRAKALETFFGGAISQFLATVPIPMRKYPASNGHQGRVESMPARDLASIAQALDKRASLRKQDPGSAVSAYDTLYAPLSDSAAHAGLAAIRRFMELRDGRVGIIESPDPLTTGRRQHVIVARLLSDLAWEVYAAFGVPTDVLRAITPWASPRA